MKTVFLILIVTILLLIVSTIIYIIKRYMNLSFIKNIDNKYISIPLKLLPIIILIIFAYLDMINTIVVVLHIFLFLILIDLILLIIKKISKKAINSNASFIITIFLVLFYLLWGYHLAHHVVQTNYSISTTKNIGMDRFRIVQISDSHVGATMDGNDFLKYMEKVNKTKPDIVVVTGDFVDDDTSAKDMIKSCEGLGNIKTKYGVYFIYGNHDKGYSNSRDFDNEDLKKELKKNNVTILEDEIFDVTNNIVLVGRQDALTTKRMPISSLTKNIDKNKYIITLDHEPNDYENEANADVDLVLSGHTHGGQLIPIGPVGVMIGANDKTYGLEKRNKTTFIVSSGIGDWAIKFKTGTISEYVVIDIKTK